MAESEDKAEKNETEAAQEAPKASSPEDKDTGDSAEPKSDSEKPKKEEKSDKAEQKDESTEKSAAGKPDDEDKNSAEDKSEEKRPEGKKDRPRKRLTIKRIYWPAYLIHLVIFAVFTSGCIAACLKPAEAGGGFEFRFPIAIILAACVGTFYLIMIALHTQIPSEHRQGLACLRQREFKVAVKHFQDSAKFFEEHAWLDRFRYVVMLSASAMSFREMALCNIGHCYQQMGKKEDSEKAYRAALKEYPNSLLAKLSLQLLKKGLSLPI